jgi:hypothetical protein
MGPVRSVMRRTVKLKRHYEATNDALKKWSESDMYGLEVGGGLSCGESRCACTHTLNMERFNRIEIKLSENRCFCPFEGPTSKTWIEELGV